MKKKPVARRLQLSKETLGNLDLMNVGGGGVLSRWYDCEWQGVSKAFSNCKYCGMTIDCV